MEHLFVLAVLLLGFFALSILALVFKVAFEKVQSSLDRRRRRKEREETEERNLLFREHARTIAALDARQEGLVVQARLEVLKGQAREKILALSVQDPAILLEFVENAFSTEYGNLWKADGLLRGFGTFRMVSALTSILPELREMTQTGRTDVGRYPAFVAGLLAREIELYHKHRSSFCQAYDLDDDFDPAFLSGLARLADSGETEASDGENELWKQDGELDQVFGHLGSERMRFFTRKLRHFRFVRAEGGHSNDGDLLAATYAPMDLERATLFFQELAHGQGLLESWKNRERLVIDQTNCSLAFHDILQADANDRRKHFSIHLDPEHRIRMETASGYEVTIGNCELALRIEEVALRHALSTVDPPIHQDHRRCICPKFYPHLFRG